MVDGRCHIEKETFSMVFVNEVKRTLCYPFLVVDVAGIIMEFFEVRLVVAINIVKSKGPHPLAEHPVIVLYLCVGGSIDLWVCGFWIGK